MTKLDYNIEPDDDAEVSVLLAPLRPSLDPDEQFVADLGERLMKEFAAAHAEPIAVEEAGHAACEDEDRTAASSDRPLTIRMHRSRRWISVGAAAACLLVASVFWGNAKYSWSTMVAALQETDWLEVIVPAPRGDSTTVWWSGRRSTLAIRSDAGSLYQDGHKQARYSSSERENLILVSPVSEKSDAESRLLKLIGLISGKSRPTVHDNNLPRWKVLNDHWNRVDEKHVELTVRFQEIGKPANTMDVLFLLDAESGLPVSARDATAEETQHPINFVPRSDGPADIYSLGVSRSIPMRDESEVGLANLNLDHGEHSEAAAGKNTDTSPVIAAPSIVDSSPLDSVTSYKEWNIASPRPVPKMQQRVDELLEQLWVRSSIAPAKVASDEEFVRRVYLDLAGRIPTVHEVRSFLSDSSEGKRQTLVDALLNSYDHSTHMASVWRSFLVPDTTSLEASDVESFEAWLTERFRTNVGYDQLVRELLLAEGRLEKGGPLVFFTAQKLQAEDVARQTSRAFLGLRLDCAQCHDDFFDKRWNQRDFWEFAAFFAQMSPLESRVERMSPVLQVRDMAGGEVTLPDHGEAIAPQFPLENSPAMTGDELSRRERLVNWMTNPHNPHFARAAVNRVWAQLFGRGLVNPVDDFSEGNEPISPELLDELAEYFVATHYDVRRLLATLTGTRAYQLSSAAVDDDPSRCLCFAQMNVKVFTAEQLYDCIVLATKAGVATGNEASSSVTRLNNYDRQIFIQSFQAPAGSSVDYQAGIAQALSLMNGSFTNLATSRPNSGLLRSLEAPFFSDEQRIDTLFLATVSRFPSQQEKDALLQTISKSETEEQEWAAYSDILWALINSAEFSLIP